MAYMLWLWLMMWGGADAASGVTRSPLPSLKSRNPLSLLTLPSASWSRPFCVGSLCDSCSAHSSSPPRAHSSRSAYRVPLASYCSPAQYLCDRLGSSLWAARTCPLMRALPRGPCRANLLAKRVLLCFVPSDSSRVFFPSPIWTPLIARASSRIPSLLRA